MSSYTTVTGDTYDSIARKVYGDDAQAFTLAAANPGAFEPLSAGLSLITPDDVTAPKTQLPQSVDVDASDVTILINGQVFYNWSGLRINRAFDAFDTFSFTAPFEPTNATFRETFRPFSFATVEIFAGEDKLLTGTMLTPIPVSEPDRTTLSVSGYSKPGVFADCTPPAPNDGFQYEFNGLTIVEIAYALGVPFGVQALGGNGAPGAVFAREAILPSQKILPFLAALARERNLVISNDEDGDLILHQEADTPTTPVATFAANEGPVNSVVPEFNPQEFYSHVTAFEPVIMGLGGGVYPVKNSQLKTVLRPYNFQAGNTESATIKTAADAAMGRMWANAVAYSLELRTWRNSVGALWKPGQFITLHWPDAMIYQDFTFFVRRVNFTKDDNHEVATLTITIPGGFAGKIPEVLPWQ